MHQSSNKNPDPRGPGSRLFGGPAAAGHEQESEVGTADGIEHGSCLRNGESSCIVPEFRQDRIGAMVQTERDERGTRRQSEGGDHHSADVGYTHASGDKGRCTRRRPQDGRSALLGRAYPSDQLLREYLPASFRHLTGEAGYGRKTRLRPGGRCGPTQLTTLASDKKGCTWDGGLDLVMYGSMNEYNPQSPHTTASREGCPSTENGHQKQVNRPSSLPVYTARDVLWQAPIVLHNCRPRARTY